jgi:hypothetical protein
MIIIIIIEIYKNICNKPAPGPHAPSGPPDLGI